MSQSREAYPGRVFVATLDPFPVDSFGERCARLIDAMALVGIQAACPGIGPLSGILVPSAEADRARSFLRTLQIDWMTGWICDETEMQGFMFGWYVDPSKKA